LKKLQLDNNLIERIENLESLVNLTYLDLSHNNITEISGLEKLVNITDLSLQHNSITMLEGMDTLTKLQVLSLGSNKLEDAQACARYLRPRKSLQAVNLQDNPMCAANGEYSLLVVAVVPQLKYLDWVKVSDEARRDARIRHAIEVDQLEFAEAEQDHKADEISKEEQIATDLAEEGVPEMASGRWFDRMFPRLSEVDILSTVPGVKEHVEQLREHFAAQSVPIREAGGEFTRHRRKIEADTQAALAEGRHSRLGGQSDALVQAWNAHKEAAFDEIEESEAPASVGLKVEDLSERLDTLKDALLDVEIHLHNDLTTQIAEANHDLVDVQRKFSEAVSMALGDLRKAEEAWSTSISEYLGRFYDGYARGAAPEGFEASSKLLHLMADKATFLGHASQLHDELTVAIDTKEDEMHSIQSKHISEHNQKIADHERVRHRRAILEIHTFIENEIFQVNDMAAHQH